MEIFSKGLENRDTNTLSSLEIPTPCQVWRYQRLVKFGDTNALSSLEIPTPCQVWRYQRLVKFGDTNALSSLEIPTPCQVRRGNIFKKIRCGDTNALSGIEIKLAFPAWSYQCLGWRGDIHAVTEILSTPLPMEKYHCHIQCNYPHQHPFDNSIASVEI